jgi:hypothetical protein
MAGMTENLIRSHLAEAKTALASLHRQKISIENQIETFERVILLEQAALDREAEAHESRRDLSRDSFQPRPPNHRHGSKSDRRLSAIRDMLTDNGPMHREEITETLVGLNLIKSGDTALQTVSMLLSSAKLFVSDGRGTWSLPRKKEELCEEMRTAEN